MTVMIIMWHHEAVWERRETGNSLPRGVWIESHPENSLGCLSYFHDSRTPAVHDRSLPIYDVSFRSPDGDLGLRRGDTITWAV